MSSSRCSNPVIVKKPYGALRILGKPDARYGRYYEVELLDGCGLFPKGSRHRMFISDWEIKPVEAVQLKLF